MSKRPPQNSSYEMDSSKKRKRPNTITTESSGGITTESSGGITTAQQLESLLGDLSSQQGLEKGVYQFYSFILECSRIHKCSEETMQQNLRVLKQWLESQSKNSGDEDEGGQTNVFRSILQVWSFAAQKPYPTAMMSITSSLSSLVRTCSQNDELKTYGTVLCKAIIQPTYLKIVYQNLRASSERVSAPTLKLLTEINKFSFGSICGLLHSTFDFTAKDITKNFGIRGGKEEIIATTENIKKPTIRTAFVRFLLSFFQYGSSSVKNEVLQQRLWITTLFRNLRYDAPYVVHEVLEAIGKKVLEDRGIPRSTKTSIFHEGTLASILTLYDRADVVYIERAGKSEEKAVKEISHEFLMKTCTIPGNGVCFQDSGWYPMKHGENDERRAGPLNVYNRTLASFVIKIRPYSDILQQDLLLGIFKACPELVASYFQSNPPFSFDPKLTSTWIGYCAFLTSAIQLPAPRHFGMGELSAVPPPINIVIENIVPKPLNKATLTKCLQENALIKFFVTRLLIFSFQKLRIVLRAMDDASKSMVDPSSNWARARSELVEEFYKRVPDMNLLVGLVNSSKGKNQIQGKLQKEASNRLLADYFELLPEVATAGNFDISTSLGSFFANIDNMEEEDRGLKVLEMGHLLRVAEDVSDIKWWNKGSRQFSPFVSILNICCGPASKMPLKQIRKLLRSFITSSNLFQSDTIASPLEALLESLSCIQDPLALNPILLFIDESAIRCIRTPFKYTDDYAELALEIMKSKTMNEKLLAVSPLSMALAEQWKFFMKSSSNSAVKHTASIWLVRFLESTVILGENKYVLAALCGRLATICEESGHLGGKSVFTTLKVRLENERYLELDHGSSDDTTPDPINCSLSTRGLFRNISHFNIASVGAVMKSIAEREIDVSLLDVAVAQKAIVNVIYSQKITSDDSCSALSKLMDLLGAILLRMKEGEDTGTLDDAKRMIATDEDWVKLFLGLPGEPSETLTKFQDFSRYAYFSERYSTLLKNSFEGYESTLKDICVQAKSSIEKMGRYLENNPDDHFTEILSTYKCTITQLFSYEHMLDSIGTFILVEGKPSELKFEVLALVLQQLSSKGQYLPLEDVKTLLAISDAPRTFYEALAEYILSVPKEEIKDLDIGHYHMDLEAELHEWMVSLDCALIRQIKSVREAALSTLDTNLHDGKNIPHLERYFSTFLSSFAVPKEDTAGFEWEKSAGSEIRQNMERLFSVVQDKMFESPPDTSQIEAFLMAASLLNSLDRNRLLKFITTDNRRSILTANTASLLKVLVQNMSPGEAESVELRNWLLMVFDHITRRFSEDKTLSDKTLDFTKQLGRLINLGIIRLNLCVPQAMLNAVLEVSLEKHIHVPEVVYFAAVIVSQLPANILEVAKLLQIVLGHAQNPLLLRDNYFDTQEISYHIAFLIYKLFFMASSKQSNVTTLDGVLPLYRGSNDIIDIALNEIIQNIEAHLARSIGGRIASWTVVESSNMPLISRARGRLTVTIDGRTVARSIFQSSPNRPIIPKEKLEQLESFMVISKNEYQHYSKTYDLGFILPALAFCLNLEEHAVEITTIIERHCLGLAITGLCSDRSVVRKMAISLIGAAATKLEKSSHREKHQLVQLLYTLFASISDKEREHGEPGLKNPIPTVIGVFIAQCVQVVANPGHYLYEKIMTLLQLAPILDLYDLPYTLQVASIERGEEYHKEISWVLGILVAGLRTAQDLKIYHNRKVFGGCLNLYVAPHCSERAKERILELLWNAAAVEGGATTLITRNAIMSFIETQAAGANKKDLVQLKRLSARLYEGSSKEHVKDWAKGNLEAHLEYIFGK